MMLMIEKICITRMVVCVCNCPEYHFYALL